MQTSTSARRLSNEPRLKLELMSCSGLLQNTIGLTHHDGDPVDAQHTRVDGQLRRLEMQAKSTL
jgi:hypothetical protein